VDAGVVVGLTWGGASLIWSTLAAIQHGGQRSLAELPANAAS
ncbi:MAG: hypothetical protein ACI9MC_001643, partial [Kiritimatiellia bacterium]